MPRRHLRPSEARTAFPMACPGGAVRKITWAVPEMMRGDERAWAGPIDSTCLTTISSALIFWAKDEGGVRAKLKRARTMNHFSRIRFWRSVIIDLSLMSPAAIIVSEADRER